MSHISEIVRFQRATLIGQLSEEYLIGIILEYVEIRLFVRYCSIDSFGRFGRSISGNSEKSR